MVKTNFFIKFLFFMSIFGILAICQSILDLSTTFSEVNQIALTQIDAIEIVATSTTLYVVQEGESIFDIANENMIAVEDILKLNDLEEDPILRVGQVIYLPNSEALYSLHSLT